MLKLAMCCLNNKKIQTAHCCPALPCPTLAPVGKNCTALTAPFNGKVTGTGVTPGTGLFFACNVPYVLQGSVVRYCDVSGTWSSVPATCSIPDIPCKYHEFKCGGSGGCISTTKVCDGVWYDCPDGSDESNRTSTHGTAAPADSTKWLHPGSQHDQLWQPDCVWLLLAILSPGTCHPHLPAEWQVGWCTTRLHIGLSHLQEWLPAILS
ncbi:uncharacterized protein LOC135822317 isoform X1 [Sycon ciliatum]|uniref:uncharacterized protein LOC135822317 isoform X1 n=1 Tax=Sycon ciliatum TaxID=27933 RepID=UPI0031F6548B